MSLCADEPLHSCANDHGRHILGAFRRMLMPLIVISKGPKRRGIAAGSPPWCSRYALHVCAFVRGRRTAKEIVNTGRLLLFVCNSKASIRDVPFSGPLRKGLTSCL